MDATAETKPESLEARVSKLEAGKKDRWDKFQILATLLIPASITLVGYLYSQASSKAETDSARRVGEQQTAMEKLVADQQAATAKMVADQQNTTAMISAKVGQAQLVASFMDALLSSDTQKQKLAFQAVLIALPEDGPRLLAALSTQGKTVKTREFAQTTLNQRRGDSGACTGLALGQQGSSEDRRRGRS